MIKKYLRTLIITSLILLIPVIVGLLFWNKLPEQLPFHWNIHGEVDNWASKPVAVFGMPALLLAIQWLCLVACMADPKRKNYDHRMLKLALWICPVVGLVLCFLTYPAALGYSVPIETVMPLLVGAMFIAIGNWLPKCRQTYTMGIKLPWTLASEENWNATHRFGGKVWVFGGIAIIASSLLGSFWIMMGIMIAMVLLPTAYSYLYYRKYEQEVTDGDE